MAYAVRVETVGGRGTVVVRRRARLGELSKVVPEGCGVVWGVVKAAGAEGAGRNVALYGGLDVAGVMEVEVGVEMAGEFEGSGEVVASALPGGRVATVVHFGPYAGLGAAHEAVRAWCAERGERLAGANWEVYGHWEKAWEREPGGIRTEVFYLLAGPR